MGGNYSSIEELKYDANLRERIKEAIQGTIKEATDYVEISKKVVKVDTKSQQVASNNINTGGHVLIGNNAKPITINQKVKAVSVVHTLHLSNYLKKQTNPLVQIVTSDLAGLSEKKASEKEMPNWYDPAYILSLLGIPTLKAEFDFDKQRIIYTPDPGKEKRDSLKEEVKKAFEERNKKQKLNKEWNDAHEVSREINQLKQEELEGYKKELKKIYESKASVELKENLTKALEQKQEAGDNYNSQMNVFLTSSLYELYHANSGRYNQNTGELILDTKTSELHKKITDNEIYKKEYKNEKEYEIFNSPAVTTINDLSQRLDEVEESSVWGDYVRYLIKAGAWSDLAELRSEVNKTPETTLLNRFSSSDYKSYLITTYGKEAYESFLKDIEAFSNAYAEYVDKSYLSALADVIAAYNKDKTYGLYLHKLLYNDEITNEQIAETLKTNEENCLIKFGNNCMGGNIVRYSDLLDKANNLNDTYNKIMKYKNEYSSAEVKYLDYQAKFKKDNKADAERVEQLEKDISALEEDLKDPEVVNALKYYEYYDTEELTDALIMKLIDNIDKEELKYKKMSNDEEETKASDELFEAYNDQWTANNDILLAKSTIEITTPYRDCANAAANTVKNYPKGPGHVTAILNEIQQSEDYKKAYDEYTKSLSENEKSVIVDIPDVIAESKNDKLYSEYTRYLNAYNNWYESVIGFQAVMNSVFNQSSKYKKEHDWEYTCIGTSWTSYMSAAEAYPKLNEIYLKMKEEFEKKYGDSFEKLGTQLKLVSNLKAIKQDIQTVIDNYDEIVNGNPKQYKTFDDLFSILSSGYVQNVNEKMETFEQKSKNIIQNIKECSDMFALNQITVQGSYNNEININQSISLVTELTNNVKIITEDIEKIKTNIKAKNKTTENIKQTTSIDDFEEEEEDTGEDYVKTPNKTESSFPTWLIIVIIILSIVFIGGAVFIIMWNTRRKKKGVKQIITVNK